MKPFNEEECDRLVKERSEVFVTTRPNLHDEKSQMTAYMGFNYLQNIYDDQKVDDKLDHEVHLEYPERWLNILELRGLQQLFFHFYPNCPKLTILTHSVYIIQCTPNGNCKVYADREQYADILVDQSKIEAVATGKGRWSVPSVNDMGLQSFGGSLTYRK